MPRMGQEGAFKGWRIRLTLSFPTPTRPPGQWLVDDYILHVVPAVQRNSLPVQAKDVADNGVHRKWIGRFFLRCNQWFKWYLLKYVSMLMLVSDVHKPLSLNQSKWNADRLRINDLFASATVAAAVWFLCGFCKPSLQLPVFLPSFNQLALVWCSESQLCRACTEEDLFTKLWQARLPPLRPCTTVLNTFLRSFFPSSLMSSGILGK